MNLRYHISHVFRFVKHVMKHPRVPKWLKYALGVLLLIPGPVDEFLALIVLVIIGAWKRDIVKECWASSHVPKEGV